MIFLRKMGLSVAECYLDEMPLAALRRERTDLIRALFRLEPLAGYHSRPATTIIVDLSQSEDTLRANLDRNTRSQIQRAQASDGFRVEATEAGLVTPDQVRDFNDYYDAFAAAKGLPLLYRPRLFALAETGILESSRVLAPDGQVLVWHAGFRLGNRLWVAHSASQLPGEGEFERRNWIGRANRLLHWEDMFRLRACGLTRYDMGGWSLLPRFAGVNRFKKGFGGSVATIYHCSRALSPKGAVALALESFREERNSARRRPKATPAAYSEAKP
jgi:hypothetical protein